jgi:hypothetical protein
MVILTTFVAPPLLHFAFGTEGEVAEANLASNSNQ